MADQTPRGVTRKAIPDSRGVHRPSDTAPASSSPSSSAAPLTHIQTQIQTDSVELAGDLPSTPPPYSGPTSSTHTIPTVSQQRQHTYAGLPALDYHLYSPKGFILSSDLTTVTTNDPKYSTYPNALVSLVQSLASVPPKPTVRILGKDGDKIDFDVRVNVMNLFVADDHGKAGRREGGKMNYVKLIAPGEKGWRGEGKESTGPTRTGLDSWAKAFCEDPASVKTFTLTRQVTNWDTAYLEGRFLALVNSTNYTGKISITFPLTHSSVVVQSPDKGNKFISSITNVFNKTRRYEIVESVWPYADVARGVPGRKIQVQEEEEWFTGWKDAIRHAVVMKRKGWCTVEDQLEYLMEPKDEEVAKWEGPAAGPATIVN